MRCVTCWPWERSRTDASHGCRRVSEAPAMSMTAEYYRRLPEGHRAPIPGAAMPAVRRSAGRDCRLLWANQAGKVGSLVNGDDPSRSSHLAHAVRPERVLPREQQAQARHRGPRGRGCTHHVRDDSRPPRGELSRRKSTGDRHTVDVEESGDRSHQLALVEEVTGVALLLRRACGLASTLDYATFGGLHTGVGACSNAMVRQCCEHPGSCAPSRVRQRSRCRYAQSRSAR